LNKGEYAVLLRTEDHLFLLEDFITTEESDICKEGITLENLISLDSSRVGLINLLVPDNGKLNLPVSS